MQFSEWKKDSNAQRKLYIFVAVLGLSMGWLYFGSAARAALRARSVRKPSAVVRAAAPVAVTPPPPARWSWRLRLLLRLRPKKYRRQNSQSSPVRCGAAPFPSLTSASVRFGWS